MIKPQGTISIPSKSEMDIKIYAWGEYFLKYYDILIESYEDYISYGDCPDYNNMYISLHSDLYGFIIIESISEPEYSCSHYGDYNLNTTEFSPIALNYNPTLDEINYDTKTKTEFLNSSVLQLSKLLQYLEKNK